MGKSLLDVQRELRIKASYIDAIENCDASVIPNRGFVAGYVRSYARYLKLDAEEIFRRFSEESGFVSETRALANTGESPPDERRRRLVTPRPAIDPALAKSAMAKPVGRSRRIGIGVSLSAIMSVMVLAGLVGGLGYGGWLLLHDIQRVGFAPSPEAPELVDRLPDVMTPGLSLRAEAAEALLGDSARDATLAALYEPADLSPPEVEMRDGPIASIDPDSAGVFAPAPVPPTAVASTAAEENSIGMADMADAALLRLGHDAPPLPTGVGVLTTQSAWIQVKTASGSTLVERVFNPGEAYDLPSNIDAARLRAGNAGGVYVAVDGEIFGPLGAAGGVVKNVSLTLEALRAKFPRATGAPDADGLFQQRAEAKID